MEQSCDESRPRNLRTSIYTFLMPRSMAREQDILKRPAPKRPPRLTSRRIGIHTSTAGGVHNAAERAYRLGCNTLQIFSSSPRQWAPYELGHPQCEEMNRLAGPVRSQPAGDPHQLSGEPGQHESVVSEKVDRSVSRRSGTRTGAVRRLSRLASRIISRCRSRSRAYCEPPLPLPRPPKGWISPTAG